LIGIDFAGIGYRWIIAPRVYEVNAWILSPEGARYRQGRSAQVSASEKDAR